MGQDLVKKLFILKLRKGFNKEIVHFKRFGGFIVCFALYWPPRKALKKLKKLKKFKMPDSWNLPRGPLRIHGEVQDLVRKVFILKLGEGI